MTYIRFSPTSPSAWEASAPVKSTKPIATITRCHGRCVATVTPGRALNLEELDSLSAFMQERERA